MKEHKSLGERIEAFLTWVVHFVTYDIWRITENEVSGLKVFYINIIKTIILAIRGFLGENLQTKASALTYNTLLAIVPMLAVLLGIAKGFGFQETVRDELLAYFPGHEVELHKAFEYVESYLVEAQGGVILGVGLILLFYTVISLISSVEDTFNMISVDGDTSTNDSVIVLANGMAGNAMIEEGSEGYEDFEEAFRFVLGELAKDIVKDGEGAGRFIEMTVSNALTKKDAKILARSVISSSLVKAAFFGADANWGRILCAMGYSGADFDPSLVDLSFSSPSGSMAVVKGGEPIPFDEEKAKRILLEKEVKVEADCHQGEASATAWGCDLTYDYVKINGDYRS